MAGSKFISFRSGQNYSRRASGFLSVPGVEHSNVTKVGLSILSGSNVRPNQITDQLERFYYIERSGSAFPRELSDNFIEMSSHPLA